MSSPTDLQGFLRNDDENLSSRLSTWLDRGDDRRGNITLPARIVVRWTAPGAASSEQLFELPITARPKEAANLIEEIEKRVVEKLGPAPVGILRVRGNGKGASASPGLDFQCTLVTESTANGTAGEALLRGMVEQFARMTREMHTAGQQDRAALMTLVADQAKTIQKLATVRTASSAAADNNSLGSVFGIMVLLMIAPFLKDIVNQADEPDGATNQLLDGMRGLVKKWLGPKGKKEADPGRQLPPPPQIPESVLSGDVTPPAPANSGLDSVIEAAKANPEAVLKGLMRDPASRAKALESFGASEEMLKMLGVDLDELTG